MPCKSWFLLKCFHQGYLDILQSKSKKKINNHVDSSFFKFTVFWDQQWLCGQVIEARGPHLISSNAAPNSMPRNGRRYMITKWQGYKTPPYHYKDPFQKFNRLAMLIKLLTPCNTSMHAYGNFGSTVTLLFESTRFIM